MKKLFIFGVLSMCSVLASAKTFLDKTNLDQLNFRVLDAGQVTWNEEDGSAVVYVGSPTEVKNIRVADPTALRGYRYKTINDELSINACSAFAQPSPGVFQWTSSNSDTYEYEYIDIEKTGRDVTYSAESGTASSASVEHWQNGLYIKNQDGTYTATTVADGTLIGGSNYVGSVQYAYRHKYVTLTLDIISKDTNIQILDYLYEQSAATGIGDMDPIGTERQIVYDGRKASLTVKVNYTSGNGKFVKLSGFSASCIGIGDVIQANDLKQNKIYIFDRITDENGRYVNKKFRKKTQGESVIYDDEEEDPTAGAFDLYELRYWAKHLYDGNRGEHWSKYSAIDHVNMSSLYGLYWPILGGSEHFLGPSGNSLLISTKGESWFEYIPATGTDSLDGTEYEGVQIAFTKISQPNGTGKDSPWVLEIMIDVPNGSTTPPQSMMDVMYCAHLERPTLWYPIVCTWESLDSGAGKEWRITVPVVYSVPDRGFWKIKFRPFAANNVLRLKCKIQAMGSDGRMYNLTWPVGGGAVTATLVE